MKKIIVRHLILWIVLSMVFFLSSEMLINLILPGIHGVEQWLLLVITGLSFILVATLISLLVKLQRARRSR